MSGVYKCNREKRHHGRHVAQLTDTYRVVVWPLVPGSHHALRRATLRWDDDMPWSFVGTTR